jgi:MFS family permease
MTSTEEKIELKLKSDDVEEGLKMSGSNHRYQVFMIFVFLFAKVVTDSFYAPLPYFLMDPNITCKDERSNRYNKECIFSEVCIKNKELSLKNQTQIKYKFIKEENFSWVTSFNIYCESFKLGVLASSASIGFLLSNIICPLLTENIGRKHTLSLTLIVGILIQSSIFFTTDFYLIYTILLLMNLTNNIVYNAASLYLNEMVDSKNRGLYSCLFNSMYGISGIIYTIVFNITFDWRILQLVTIGSGSIALILNLIFMRESIRYLFIKNKNKEILDTLTYISKFNGKHDRFNEWKEKLIADDLNDSHYRSNHSSSILKKEKNPISLIFTNDTVIYNFITFCVVSLVTISGLIYNAIEIKTSKDTFLVPIVFYFTYFLIILVTGFLIDLPIFGRKKPSIVFSITGGVLYLVKYFSIVKFGEGTSIFWLDYLIRLSVSVSFNILIEYNLEIYSTDIRATAFNINKLFSRLGDFTLPLILASDRALATILLGGLYLFMSIFIFKLKETRGKKLKDFIDDESVSLDDEEEDHEKFIKNKT